jgi:hypothetical protein
MQDFGRLHARRSVPKLSDWNLGHLQNAWKNEAKGRLKIKHLANSRNWVLERRFVVCKSALAEKKREFYTREKRKLREQK